MGGMKGGGDLGARAKENAVRRKQRVASELRANLRKRKAQERARADRSGSHAGDQGGGEGQADR